jgi:hypothetical protein
LILGTTTGGSVNEPPFGHVCEVYAKQSSHTSSINSKNIPIQRKLQEKNTITIAEKPKNMV